MGLATRRQLMGLAPPKQICKRLDGSTLRDAISSLRVSSGRPEALASERATAANLKLSWSVPAHRRLAASLLGDKSTELGHDRQAIVYDPSPRCVAMTMRSDAADNLGRRRARACLYRTAFLPLRHFGAQVPLLRSNRYGPEPYPLG